MATFADDVPIQPSTYCGFSIVTFYLPGSTMVIATREAQYQEIYVPWFHWDNLVNTIVLQIC